jgi:hypothetical protein
MLVVVFARSYRLAGGRFVRLGLASEVPPWKTNSIATSLLSRAALAHPLSIPFYLATSPPHPIFIKKTRSLDLTILTVPSMLGFISWRQLYEVLRTPAVASQPPREGRAKN